MIGLFSFRGRISRLGFWRVQLLCTAVAAGATTLGIFAIMNFGPLGGLLLAPLAPALVVTVAIALRRLHDRNKGLGWLALYQLGPFALLELAQHFVAQGSAADALASLPFSLGGLGLLVWAWVEVGFLVRQAKLARSSRCKSGLGKG